MIVVPHSFPFVPIAPITLLSIVERYDSRLSDDVLFGTLLKRYDGESLLLLLHLLCYSNSLLLHSPHPDCHLLFGDDDPT